jgi:hypothetical protein
MGEKMWKQYGDFGLRRNERQFSAAANFGELKTLEPKFMREVVVDCGSVSVGSARKLPYRGKTFQIKPAKLLHPIH